MRSELVFGAMAHISNRYLLSRFAAKAIRKFHRPNTRIEDTMNDVLLRFNRSNPMAAVRSGQGRACVSLRESHLRCAS
jgi:hypothetical protein